jgi:type IV secretion system protein TrbL
VGNVARTGAQAAGQRVAAGARAFGERVAGAFRGEGGATAGASTEAGASSASSTSAATNQEQPAWAKRLHRRQQIAHAATTTAHTLRGGDGGGSAQGPSLGQSDE